MMGQKNWKPRCDIFTAEVVCAPWEDEGCPSLLCRLERLILSLLGEREGEGEGDGVGDAPGGSRPDERRLPSP